MPTVKSLALEALNDPIMATCSYLRHPLQVGVAVVQHNKRAQNKSPT